MTCANSRSRVTSARAAGQFMSKARMTIQMSAKMRKGEKSQIGAMPPDWKATNSERRFRLSTVQSVAKSSAAGSTSTSMTGICRL